MVFAIYGLFVLAVFLFAALGLALSGCFWFGFGVGFCVGPGLC